jgi:superfamily II DNA or RNA helicase
VKDAAAPSATAGVFGDLGLVRELWPHQARALEAVERARARGAGTRGSAAAYVVVPPGGGKTLIGLEAVRRIGRPAIVLSPNTAIQAQWVAQWQASFQAAGAPPADSAAATMSRELPTALTVLTYQAICTLEPGQDAAARAGGAPLDLLHPHGRELVERLRAGGPWTVVLDECHHLLEMWGRLLRDVLAELGRPHVIGLTATPPHLMTADQRALHAMLFGQVDLEISAPALVRGGRLAPYQELAYFSGPTPAEADYIHGAAIRFAELRAGLLDPGFASTPFLAWLQARVVERRGPGGAPVSWQRFARDEPALADGALRLHTAGLLPLPDGAQVREQHRHAPTAADWVALIGDYCQRCLLGSGDPRDEQAYQAIRRVLPSVGYRLTRAGVRGGISPVDRVLARSASKAYAAIEILAAETAELGPRLRALVLCDHEEASGTLPADLAGVLRAEAGGAQLVLETLLADPRAAALDPVLMTGQRVACGPDTADRLLSWLRAAAPGCDLAAAALGGWAHAREITGSGGWDARRYVPLITRFYAEGGCRCLIGTRALLGEGWDAPAVNVVIDLTVAATPTSVVQARGRALRLDAAWPAKVADNWGVICIAADHPKGGADYGRFVRKHDHYFALEAAGDIVSGVGHVDLRLSPYGPPPPEEFDALNAQMLQRAAQRDTARQRWAIGTPYQDEPVATVTVRSRGPLGLSGRRLRLPMLADPAGRRRAGRRRWAWGAALAAAAVLAFAAAGPAVGVILAASAAVAGLAVLGRAAARVAGAGSDGCLEDIAQATADALHAAGLTSRDGAAVLIEARPDGSYRARLRDVPAAESSQFTQALEETLAPLAQPRYVISRLIISPPRGPGGAAALAIRRAATGHVPAAVIYHAVPAALSANKKLASMFERSWNARVSPGQALFTGSPEGAGALAAQRGDDPFALTTQIRTLWR